MTAATLPLQLLLLTVSGWVHRHQQDVIAYLVEENRVLKEQLGGRKLRLTDDQRRRLAAKARLLWRRALDAVATLVTALVRGDHALGAFYRRLAARTDKPTAMTATARKLALLVYRMLTYNMPDHHTSAAEYDTRQRTRILRGLRKRATSLGFELVEASTGLVV